MSERESDCRAEWVQPPPTAAFLAGYEKAKADAIAQCLAQRAPKTHPEWRGHNVAIGLAVVAIRALDGRISP